MSTISNRDDIIDSRDVIERLEELQDARTALVDALADAEEAFFAADTPGPVRDQLEAAMDAAVSALQAWNDDDGAELDALQSLADEASGYADDWQHGVPLIRDSHFDSYVEDLLDDCGDLPKDLPHYIVIDWHATAENIKQDYTSVDFDGVTYWVR